MDSRSLTRNVGWLWAGYVGRAGGYFLLIVVLTRALGTAGFGVVSLFLALTLGVSLVAGSWPFLAVPVLSAGERSIGAAFRPSLYVAALATGASLLVAIPLAVALGIDSPTSLVCVVLSAVALVGLQGIFAVQQTEGRMGEIAALQTLERVIALALALAIVAATSLGVIGSQVLLTIASVVTFAIAVVVVERRQRLFRAPTEEIPDHPIGTVMGAVGAMGIVSLASYGVAYADIFILAIFRSDADVGIYSLAYQVFTFVTALTSYWLVAALPEHARSTASGQELKEQLPIPRLLTYLGLWATLVGVTGVVAAFVLPVVFGSGFEDTAAPLLLLLGGSGVFSVIYYALLAALVGARRSELVARVSIASVAVNIGLDLILVPPFGVVGPSFATMGQTLVGTFALAFVVLGREACLMIAAVSAPVVATTMLLAIQPSSVPLAALALLAALATGLWALRHGGPISGLRLTSRGSSS
ncbi:MAG: oligosaccharide flippase family protein [Actinobacteria bacterium]|nr:oligosaccharide flippase family protein [Actinomycetota bacterium]